MTTATLSRTVRRLAARAGEFCPCCAHWPNEVALRVVEVVVEPDGPLPAPDPPGPIEYGPCPNCHKVHRPVVVDILGD
jgi:hypothetical protein